MQFFDGMRCPVCDVGTLNSHQEAITFEYKGHKTIFEAALVFTCSNCHESFLDPHDERERQR